MSLNHGSKIVTNGLILMLDAANKKSYIQYSTFLNMASWTPGGGTVSPYNANQDADENLRLTGTNPWGQSAIVWQSMPSGNSNPDGGWNTDGFGIDKTKLYRFSVWMKRISDSTSGTFYLGLGPCVIRNVDSVEECNPYWECANIAGYTKDQWYLVVGHCFPYTYNGTTAHPNSGVYTTSGRVSVFNGCNTGSGDVRWKSDSTYTYHRAYHYYSPDTTSHLQFYDPRIDLVDGTEPSITQLWSQSPLTWKDLSGKGNNVIIVTTGITYNSSNYGSLVFNGTSNKIVANIAYSSLNTIGRSWEIFVNPSSSQTYAGLFGHAMGEGCSYFCNGGIVIWSGNYQFNWYDNSNYQFLDSGIAATSNNWMYIAGTYDSTDNKIRIYVNGILKNTSSSTNLSYGSTSNFYIIGYMNNAGYYFNGQLSNIKHYYNKALSPSEVLQNFNATKGRFGL